jgi:hypothetical protein
VRYTRLQAKDARYDELHQRHEASVRAHAEELERKDLHHIQVCAQHIVSALSTTVTPSVKMIYTSNVRLVQHTVQCSTVVVDISHTHSAALHL